MRSGRRLATGVLVALGLLWWLARPRGDAEGRSARVPPSRSEPARDGAHSKVATRPTRAAPGSTISAERSPASTERASNAPLDAYLQSSIYPPSSRPLAAAMRDLIDYRQRYERPRPTHERGVSYLLTADRAWLVGDEPVTVRLEVRDQAGPLRVPASASVEVLGSDRSWPLALRPSEGGYVATSRPARELSSRQSARLRVVARFVVAGAEEEAAIELAFTPAAAVPARFTGRFRDAVLDGSLQVEAEVEVQRGGHYLIDANLYDRRDGPVAWTRFKGGLEGGPQWVGLSFFGKVIRDANARGPFRVAQLRGALLDPRADPDVQHMAPWENPIYTRAYDPGDFSDAVYDSTFKQAKIASLRQLAASGPQVDAPP